MRQVFLDMFKAQKYWCDDEILRNCEINLLL